MCCLTKKNTRYLKLFRTESFVLSVCCCCCLSKSPPHCVLFLTYFSHIWRHHQWKDENDTIILLILFYKVIFLCCFCCCCCFFKGTVCNNLGALYQLLSRWITTAVKSNKPSASSKPQPLVKPCMPFGFSFKENE